MEFFAGTPPMKISVVIPTFKRPELLTRCLHALALQNFSSSEYEVIVVSDGPDNITHTLVENFGSGKISIRYVATRQKAGPAAARNLGWRIARSPLIVFTDDDCIPGCEWLSHFHRAYTEAKLDLVAFTGYTRVPIPDDPTDYQLNISRLAEAEFITANCACTKLALLTVNGFDEAFTMAWREDSDLQFKFLIFNIPILPVKSAIVVHPVRDAPWGVSLKEERKGIFNALLYKKFPEMYKQRLDSRPPWHYYIITIFLVVSFIGLASMNQQLLFAGAAGWLVLTLLFALKRLSKTSKKPAHIAEMVVTSACLPPLSMYYKIKGSIRYRTLFFP